MLPFAGPGDGWQTGRVADDQTSTVRGDAELIARAGHLFDAVHEEFVCAARDMATWSQPEARSAVARRVRAPGTDNFTVRNAFPGRPNGSAVNQLRTNEIQLTSDV